ncbi:CbiX/SirB N-terminal domain-containing protein [Romboutsia sedimentorum]|uniref:CbiX/SirB N-terminal domain-containing protein n=1 Tax=Romboutsia sedimentorum TaxID=1368474 RepID=A0ABT7EAD4_9FIRM|nr:CbiX/SirB N-terminal domain-containing protein [Romboutsia sedimentorum]MDK2563033.1 CbiX/SirB N-terminal domain-containing protein [Romboutsia sedimentorum]
MLLSILLFISIAFSFIFKGYMENIFIVLATLIIYKQVIINKDYKYMLYAFIISFISVNLIIAFSFKDEISFKDVKVGEDKEETLILLVSEGEAKHYDIKERAIQINYENGYKSILSGIKSLYDYKTYYNQLEDSTFKDEANEVATKLSNQLGEKYKIVNSYMYTKPYFENSLEDVISKGYKKIIVCPLFMTEGKDYEVFKERYEKLNLLPLDLEQIEILEPFYKSNNLAMVYKDEILKNVRNLGEDAGVLLIGLYDKNNLEQDILFREKIKEYIEYEEKNIDIQIKLPLLENNKQDIIKSGEELLEYGIHTLYVVTPTCTIDTMYTKHLAKSILEDLDMGNTKFYYIDPDKKEDAIVEELFTRISLRNK